MDEVMMMLAKYPVEERIELVKQAFEDKARLDKMQALTEREMYTGRMKASLQQADGDEIAGWHLYETDEDGADSDVRGAIDRFFAELDPEGDMLAQ